MSYSADDLYTLYSNTVQRVNKNPRDFAALYQSYLKYCLAHKEEVTVQDVQRNIKLYQEEHL